MLKTTDTPLTSCKLIVFLPLLWYCDDNWFVRGSANTKSLSGHDTRLPTVNMFSSPDPFDMYSFTLTGQTIIINHS